MGNFQNKNDPFKDAQTWSDFVDANVAFLQGKLPRSPYYLEAMDADTVPLLQQLIAIQRLGFISINGQAGLISDDKTHQQRSYIVGFLPMGHLVTMIRFLKDHRKKYVARVFQLTSNSQSEFGFDVVPIYVDKRLEKPYNLTKYTAEHMLPEVIENMNLQKKGKFYFFSNFFPTTDSNKYGWLYPFLKYRNLLQILQRNLMIEIAAVDYGSSGSVEDLLMDYFSNIRH